MLRNLPIDGMATARLSYGTEFRYLNRFAPLSSPMRTGSLDLDVFIYDPPDVLRHGREYSADSDGDGPSVSKDLFIKAWPPLSSWIQKNRRAGNTRSIYMMCVSQKAFILKIAFMRLHFKRIAQQGGFGEQRRGRDEQIFRRRRPV